MLITADLLVNGQTIEWVDCDDVDSLTYYHIELEDHDVVLANGVPAETLKEMKTGSGLTTTRTMSRALGRRRCPWLRMPPSFVGAADVPTWRRAGVASSPLSGTAARLSSAFATG